MKIKECGFIDPTDRLDKRWERIQQLVNDGERPGKWEDKHVWKGFHFLRAYEDARTNTDEYMLCLKNKAVARALGWNKEPGQRRYLLEALLLCRDLTDEGIANYLQESLAAIAVYKKLFFDIGDNKGKPGYVAKHVFQPALLAKLHDTKHPDIGWKLAATFGGFELVRSYWEVTSMPDNVQEMCNSTGAALLTRNFCMGSFARPVNRYTINAITDQLLRYLELQVKREMVDGNSDSGMGDKLTMMAEIMESVKFTMVEPDEPVTAARELRLDEKMALATGSLLPYPVQECANA